MLVILISAYLLLTFKMENDTPLSLRRSMATYDYGKFYVLPLKGGYDD